MREPPASHLHTAPPPRTPHTPRLQLMRWFRRPGVFLNCSLVSQLHSLHLDLFISP